MISDAGPRRWKPAEVATVQQVANFLARAISQAEYEEQRHDYVSRLENLDRQKTEFLSTVSHELRTPLTSIQGYLELLLEGEVGPMSSGQRHMLGVIERNTNRLRGPRDLTGAAARGALRARDPLSSISNRCSSAYKLEAAGPAWGPPARD